jgi:ATP-dependent exoDNAse (exonuclease V) beta subunit
MTIHSSKGLEFDCVILPFSNYVNEHNEVHSYNLPYVALTRSSHQIIITYSGLIADEYSKHISKDVYTGQIEKYSEIHGPTQPQIEWLIRYDSLQHLPKDSQLKSIPGLEYLDYMNEEMNTSDCDDFRRPPPYV